MLALSACGSSDNVVTSKVGNVTEKELSKNYDNNMEKVLYIK